MSDGALLYQHHKGVMEVTLNAPATLNALTAAMAHELVQKLWAWRDDDSIRCIVIRGSGDRAFCAGGDIQQLYQHLVVENYAACNAFFAIEYQLDYALHRYPKPIVAWVDGIVMGGGMGIMQGCSHRVVTDKVRMAMPETHIGLIPDVGSGDFLNQQSNRLAWLLPLTGGHIFLPEVMYLGLADYFVEATAYDAFIGQIQQEVDITDAVRGIAQTSESSWLEMHHQVLAAALTESLDVTFQALRNIDDAMVQQFCRRMDYASPLALHTSWQHLLTCQGWVVDGQEMDRAAVLQQEYNLVTALCRHGEFAEGIRALIIDKDNAPNWSDNHDFWFETHTPLDLTINSTT